MEEISHLPIVLAILDGWGMSPSWGGNAITMGSPPTMNALWRDFPHAILQAFRQVAGSYQMVGNSEIGHSSIGAGKIVFQDLERISKSIQDKTFFQNPALLAAARNALSYNSSLHLIGLVSDGGIHSHIKHLFALLRFAKLQNLPKVYIHVITDGLDTDSTSALKYVSNLEKYIAEIGVGEIATVCGRAFAMDKDNRWENIVRTMQAMTHGIGNASDSALSVISNAYKAGYTDQYIPPTVIKKNGYPTGKITENDSLIFYNFRPDRARELTLALLGMHEVRKKFAAPTTLTFVTFTSYYLPASIEKKTNIAFPGEKIQKTLGKIISDNGLKQFRLAESEKSPHVTYFFDCGSEELLPGEERMIINSPRVQSYAEKPEMSAAELTDKLILAIKSGKFHFILVNFANVDCVGHSGDLIAATQAVTIVDDCIKKVSEAVLSEDATLIITADHGNAEQMIQVRGSRDRETFHTLSPVPFILVRKDLKDMGRGLIAGGDILSSMVSSKLSLADIAPTVLELFGIPKPKEMTGRSLLSEIIYNKPR